MRRLPRGYRKLLFRFLNLLQKFVVYRRRAVTLQILRVDHVKDNTLVNQKDVSQRQLCDDAWGFFAKLQMPFQLPVRFVQSDLNYEA